MDYNPPGSSVQARMLEWGAISFPGGLPNPGIKPTSPASPALADGFFTTEPPRKPFKATEIFRRTIKEGRRLFLSYLSILSLFFHILHNFEFSFVV